MAQRTALIVLLLTGMATVCWSLGEETPLHTARDKVHMKIKAEEEVKQETAGEDDKPKSWAGWALNKFTGVFHHDKAKDADESVADKTKDTGSKAGNTAKSPAGDASQKAGEAAKTTTVSSDASAPASAKASGPASAKVGSSGPASAPISASVKIGSFGPAASGPASAKVGSDMASNAATTTKDKASDAGAYASDKTSGMKEAMEGGMQYGKEVYSNTKSAFGSAKDTMTDTAMKGYEMTKQAVGAKA